MSVCGCTCQMKLVPMVEEDFKITGLTTGIECVELYDGRQ